jgi:hypothetical protein
MKRLKTSEQVSETGRGAKPTSFAQLIISKFNVEVAARGYGLAP